MSVEDAETMSLMMQNLSTLRDEPSFSDVTVIVENSEFLCHCNILGSASDFFKAAFTSDMKEAREGKIILHGLDKDVFEKILDCLYRGKYILTEENLFDVWAAADMLQVGLLISQCQKLMKSTLSTKNAIAYLFKVRPFGENDKRHVLEFICDNIKLEETHFSDQVFLRDEIKFILGKDTIKVPENRLVGFLLLWAETQDKIIASEQVDSGAELRDNAVEPQLKNGSKKTGTDLLAELLQCTRYFLLPASYLHGVLKHHRLIQGNERCEAIIAKILWYQSQAQLQQSWCPPAARHRQHSDMVNVLMICKVDNSKISILSLTSMEWRYVYLQNSKSGSKVLCNSNLFIFHCGELSLYIHRYLGSLQLPTVSVYGCEFVRIIGNTIYYYQFKAQETNLIVTEVSNSSPVSHLLSAIRTSDTRIVDSKLEKMSIKEVTCIDNTHVVFFGRNDLDSYTIVCIDSVHQRHKLYQNQLGSQSKLVTFCHEREVFVLQENGCLWRIRQEGPDLLDINLTQELVLWENEVSLAGAALYNDELLIVGKFPDQTTGFEVLKRSLDGVFESVRKIKRSEDIDNQCPRISLAALPRSMIGS